MTGNCIIMEKSSTDLNLVGGSCVFFEAPTSTSARIVSLPPTLATLPADESPETAVFALSAVGGTADQGLGYRPKGFQQTLGTEASPASVLEV